MSSFFEALRQSWNGANQANQSNQGTYVPGVTKVNRSAVTENGALSYETTRNARVELFFKMCRGLEPNQMYPMLEAAWQEDPKDVLKICFSARDCRGGKGEREIFQHAMAWLGNYSPENLVGNLKLVPEYGTWLDLVKIAYHTPAVAPTVWNMFARQLETDYQAMLEGKATSLVAKWVPTEKSKWDREMKATSKIAEALGVSLRQLRKKYLSPLRTYLKVVERYMCTGKWDEIDYNGVPSYAMKKLKQAFARNDPNRFIAWMEALKKSDPNTGAKVNAKTLFPHDLVKEYLNCGYRSVIDEVTEAQWKVLLDEARSWGSLNKTLAVCDVSGSMSWEGGLPLQVSVALGIMVSQLTNEPFKGGLITFSTNPELHLVPSGSLMEQVASVSQMHWHASTDFQAVFNLILSRAVEARLSPDQMPTRILVFSDMQFDQAESSRGQVCTNYEYLKEAYARYGYQLPKIVFWNLRGNTLDFPVANSHQKGVALVSGYSPQTLKAILHDREISPYSVMRDTIDQPRYSQVRYY